MSAVGPQRRIADIGRRYPETFGDLCSTQVLAKCMVAFALFPWRHHREAVGTVAIVKINSRSCVKTRSIQVAHATKLNSAATCIIKSVDQLRAASGAMLQTRFDLVAFVITVTGFSAAGRAIREIATFDRRGSFNERHFSFCHPLRNRRSECRVRDLTNSVCSRWTLFMNAAQR